MGLDVLITQFIASFLNAILVYIFGTGTGGGGLDFASFLTSLLTNGSA